MADPFPPHARHTWFNLSTMSYVGNAARDRQLRGRNLALASAASRSGSLYNLLTGRLPNLPANLKHI